MIPDLRWYDIVYFWSYRFQMGPEKGMWRFAGNQTERDIYKYTISLVSVVGLEPAAWEFHNPETMSSGLLHSLLWPIELNRHKVMTSQSPDHRCSYGLPKVFIQSYSKWAFVFSYLNYRDWLSSWCPHRKLWTLVPEVGVEPTNTWFWVKLLCQFGYSGIYQSHHQCGYFSIRRRNIKPPIGNGMWYR